MKAPRAILAVAFTAPVHANRPLDRVFSSQQQRTMKKKREAISPMRSLVSPALRFSNDFVIVFPAELIQQHPDSADAYSGARP